MILRYFLALAGFFVATDGALHAQSYSSRARKTLGAGLTQIETGIRAQRQAGHPRYNPVYVFVVDPARQRLHVLSRQRRDIVATVKCGTGKRGLGFDHAQTPPGFFTMGGVRIARNGDCSIQTGDTKKGVAGIYAEMLYPPSHPDPKLRGRVPNNVVIHSYNPEASPMLRDRKTRKLIGRTPCTTGCPVPGTHETRKLIPYLKASAGSFDPDARPNATLRALIARRKVTQYSRKTLGGAIYVMNGR